MEESGRRYELIAETIMQALAELGVSASLAEAPGEWCPGAWSVQGPSGKLAGLAQRVISGGAWCEALIVIERDPVLTSLAHRVHEALDLAWSERAQGERAELLLGQADLHARICGALTNALAARWPALRPAPLADAERDRAVKLAEEHRWT
jgi:octanoyl-[GcvH]:protein N-octanoyltransferase